MRRTFLFLLGGTSLIAAGAATAAPGHRHAHHRAVSAARAPAPPAYGYGYGYGPYGGPNWEYDTIARATARAQTEPGVTNEIAPDSEQTATGGPSGGIPGYGGF